MRLELAREKQKRREGKVHWYLESAEAGQRSVGEWGGLLGQPSPKPINLGLGLRAVAYRSTQWVWCDMKEE